MSKIGTVVNEDGDFLRLLDIDKDNPQIAVENFIKNYDNSDVSDVVLTIFCQQSVTPTNVWTFRGDVLERKEENGIAVDYTANETIRKWLENSKNAFTDKFDAVDYCIKRIYQMGINPWISIRMNDCHFGGEKTSWIRSDFYYEAEKNGWLIGSGKYGGYYGSCFDYAVPKVRQMMLDYIEEQLTRYDVYGLELDFLREMFCFDFANNKEMFSIMNDFIKRVKEITCKIEKMRGKDIKLMVRLPRDIKSCKRYGFDVLTWAKEGLIDIVSPCARYVTTDTGMPIKEWFDLLSPFGVDVYAGIEGYAYPGIFNTEETMRAMLAQYIPQGSKKLYLYNLFVHGNLELNKKLWEIASDIDNANKGVRRHIVTFQDDIFAQDGEYWYPIPKGFAAQSFLKVETGKIDSNAKVYLYLGVRPHGMMLWLNVNGTSVTQCESDNDAFVSKNGEFAGKEIRCYEVPAHAVSNSAAQIIELGVPSHGEITYVEMKVIN